jgi:hypothetical protein
MMMMMMIPNKLFNFSSSSVFVLSNFLKNLSDEWNFVIFHGTTNTDFIVNILDNVIPEHKNRFKLEDLNVENLNIDDYNKLLFSHHFYDKIPTEMFLIFQTDTFICKQFKDNIYNYMSYDYVGAPWRDRPWFQHDGVNGCSEINVGNGGLSLRRKSKMLEILNNCRYHDMYEDVFFSQLYCDCDSKIELNKPTVEEAKKFSIETTYSPESFGVHKSWEYVREDLSFCEDLDKLIKIYKK